MIMDIILNWSNGYNKNFHLKKYHVSSLLCLPQGFKTYVVLIKKNSLFEHEIALAQALKNILDKNFFYKISFLLYLGHFNPISIFNFKNFLWWKHLMYLNSKDQTYIFAKYLDLCVSLNPKIEFTWTLDLCFY